MEEKDAIFEIVNYSKKLKWTPGTNLSTGVAFFGGKNDFQQTVFGRRFIERLTLLAQGPEEQCSCILCEKNESVNGIICQTCLENLEDSAEEYAETHFVKLVRQGGTEIESKADVSGIKKAIAQSDNYTKNLLKNLDASIDKLASKNAMRSMNRMLMTILVVCLINTISIISIAFIVFKVLQTM